MDAFRQAILALPLEFHLTATPSVRFRSLRGKMLEFTYGQIPLVNGAPLDYAHWPLFGGPFVEAAVDSEQLTTEVRQDAPHAGLPPAHGYRHAVGTGGAAARHVPL